MSYISEKPGKLRPEFEVDLPRFARDIAKAMGGTVVAPKGAAGVFPALSQEVKFGDNVITFSWIGQYQGRDKQRVGVSIKAPEVAWDDRDRYDRTHKVETITINPDARSTSVIVNDIKKRVVEASAPALAKQREHAAKLAANRDNVEAQAANLRKAVPGLKVRVSEDKQSATFYLAEPYISGNVIADGTLRIEHIDKVDFTKFVKIVEVIRS